ncbi:Uncharacterised protein [Citrobacter youngae]|uniref:DUF3137 domain-containing protein n=1 Tax=Citrobacter youngae TaxID=133448 RepID=A0ABM8MLK0_9ENTR|nr:MULTISPECIES: hypothetical protein [Citrobacter freundii complex]OUE79338.1 hypothetical protein AZ013_004381 [Citrobacter freundii]KLV49979.1 hypothetical protein SK32_00663 [Citrobacter sp. MGH100]CAB5589185.1 Uncharacterised protein [Citrobacter youngae]CAC9137377.1 Uncharacterised protein [Citrobacter youngae]HEM7415471.1 hypothetical protein [Citrobacter youngae]
MSNKTIADLLAFKTNLFEVLIIAIFLTLGVNFFSSGIAGYFNLSFPNLIFFGSLLIFIGLVVFLRNSHPIVSGKYDYEGVICIEKNTKELLEIEGYNFAEEVSGYIKALCAENNALHKIWTNESLGPSFSFAKNKAISGVRPKANDLLTEAMEYYVLDLLSMHLSGHFDNNPLFSEENLVTLEREHIPDILLKNRYIDMFSRPMEEREKFIDYDSNPSNGKVIYATGKDGAIFENFEMVLPKGSSIIREEDTSISIITKRFKLRFRPIFSGCNSVLPRRFTELYMGKTFNSISIFDAQLKISVDFSFRSLLTSKGWEYYWWLDSFLGELEESFSKNNFLSKISWHQNAAMNIIAENRRKSQVDSFSSNQHRI